LGKHDDVPGPVRESLKHEIQGGTLVHTPSIPC
jgi:hypothetical protein